MTEGYRTDERLQKPIILSHARSPLSAVARDLETATGVRFSLARRISNDAITCLVSGRPASQVLAALGSVMRYRITSDDAGGYRLDLYPAESEVVANLRRQVDALETELANRTQRAIARGLAKALSGDPAAEQDLEVRTARERSPELLDVLRDLPPGVLETLAAAASQPPGPIAADGNDHLVGRIYARRPLSSFPPDFQSRLRQVFASNAAHGKTFPREADPLIGILAAHGGFSLCAEVAGEVFCAPAAPFGGPETRAAAAEIRAVRRQMLIPVERLETANDALWLDPQRQALPLKCTRNWKRGSLVLGAVTRPDMGRADRVLTELARQAGMSIVADSFSRTTFVPWVSGLGDRPISRSAADWARAVAIAFDRKYRCEQGILLLRSRHFVWDRYAELPGELVEDLARAKQENGRLELREYVLATAALAREQIRTLGGIRTDEGITFGREALVMERQRPLLTLLSILPSATNTKAGSDSVTQALVPEAFRGLFARLLLSGHPLPPLPSSEGGNQPSVSWEIRGDEALVELTDPGSRSRALHRIALGPRGVRSQPPLSSPAGVDR